MRRASIFSASWAVLGGFVFLAGLPLLINSELAAATKRERTQEAEYLVERALTAEARGYSAEDRTWLLNAALEQVPDFDAARWHSGQVKWNKDWTPADQVPQKVAEDPRFQAYLKIRDRYEVTVDGQWQLAAWCDGHHLPDQRRAHLTKILELEPDHAAARAALGFVRADAQWVHPDEIAQASARSKEIADALRDWLPKCQQLLRGLQNTSLARRQAAADELKNFDDGAAIPALEQTFSTVDEPTAKLLVEVLSSFTGHEATMALARQAVFSPWPEVQAAATKVLVERPKDAYVPELLAAMYTPVQSRAELYRGPGGRLMYRHVFTREGQDAKEQTVLETGYRRKRVAGGDGVETLNRALLGANQSYQEREAAVAAQNAAAQELNTRICSTLSRATGEVLPQQPEAWWQWWSEYNEVFHVDPKPTIERFAQQEITLVDSSPQSSGLDGPSGSSGGSVSQPMDCLARGTLVQTMIGPISIEAVQVGDMVLSQDIATGELAYKPVLRTTVRPVSKLVKIQCGQQELIASGGHLFWVSGKGWVKAREIAAGDRLHQSTAAAEVTAVSDGPTEETYNLIVADFHTYFAGSDRLLSHDNTIHERTDLIVPGLVKK